MRQRKSAEGTGLESAGDSLSSGNIDYTYEKGDEASAVNALQSGNCVCPSLSLADADLRELFAKWIQVPPETRRAIMLLVRQ